MSYFNELLPKILEISKISINNINNEFEAALERLDKFEEECLNGRTSTREKALKDKAHMTTLQSINESDDEPTKPTKNDKTDGKSNDDVKSSTESGDGKRRVSKKRSKDEVEGMSSPEQDKRQKRNASVKAQSIITKQVNVNLTQKMRREGSTDKARQRRHKEEDKENEPAPVLNIKQEKISLPPETMDAASLTLDVPIKQENDFAMPVAPAPKPRKAVQKDISVESSEEESGSGRRRTTRTRKQTDTMPPPPVPSARAVRASSRATRQPEPEATPAEPRPKRTRTKKKVSEPPVTEPDKDTTQESEIGSSAEKPRPKRTRRGQKAAEKETQKPEEPDPEPQKEPETKELSPKREIISQPDSPVLQKDVKQPKTKKIPKATKKDKKDEEEKRTEEQRTEVLDETRVIAKLDATVTLSNDMDKTMVLPNGLYHHAPVTPKTVCDVNETMVLETISRETMVLDKPHIADSTVVLDKAPRDSGTGHINMTDDSSLITNDSDALTPPQQILKTQPSSAVKEKVQQFEELAARTTRTKTRAMAKMEDDDTQTPPDKMIKPVLSAETLTKMNNIIFNVKVPHISSSASKPSALPAPSKNVQPASTSKLSALSRYKEAAEETLKREKEDARKKKEAMLEAKRELQRKKREDKMAAAAAARSAADQTRRAALQAAERGRQEKQAHADLGKLERRREAERKKQELARKVAETEERRRAEEQSRQQRLAEEQKRAEAARRKQLEEAEAMKKEAAIMAKEIEKRQKEYLEKQKMKHRMENDKIHTPLKTPGTPSYLPMEPVYMQDGFQHLNSDEDEEPAPRPVPAWSTSKMRKLVLVTQSRVSPALIDSLFSVRVHSPDLRAIFPGIERSRLKRTSSAVWRTPPRPPTIAE